MNNQDIDLLDICLEDSLFAALYGALCNLEKNGRHHRLLICG